MRSVPIKRSLECVPGGMMLLPLVAGAVVVTLFPNIGTFFGSFTGALFNSAMPVLAVFFVCMGSLIDLRALPKIARQGGVLLAAKTGIGVVAAIVLGRMLGEQPIHSGALAGLSTLAVVAAINDTNGGLYMALTAQYGLASESAAYSIMALESGPFLTMLTLGAAGLAGFPWQTMLGAVLPLAFGMLLGNLDPEVRRFFGGAAPVLIPFFAFGLGATLNLHKVWGAGAVGIALGVAVVAVCAPVLWLADRLVGGNGTAGIAASATASNAAAVPALVAAANAKYAAAAGSATALVAASVFTTCVLVPPLTAWWARRVSAQRTIQTNQEISV